MYFWKFPHRKEITLVVLVTQSCPTFCDPMVCILPGSSVPGILQARILEWVAIPFSRGSPNPWIKPRSSTLQADSLLSEPLETSWDTSSCLFLLSVLSGTSPLSLLSYCPTLQTGHLILFPFWCNAAHLGSLHLSTSSSRSPLRAQFPTEVLKIIEKDESFPGRRILL